MDHRCGAPRQARAVRCGAQCPFSTYDGTFVASNTITRLAKAIDIDKSFIVLSLSDQCSRRRLLFDDSAGPTDALSHASRQLSGGHVLLTFTISCETPAEVAHVQEKVANLV